MSGRKRQRGGALVRKEAELVALSKRWHKITDQAYEKVEGLVSGEDPEAKYAWKNASVQARVSLEIVKQEAANGREAQATARAFGTVILSARARDGGDWEARAQRQDMLARKDDPNRSLVDEALEVIDVEAEAME